MRDEVNTENLSVRVVAGTEVVLLAVRVSELGYFSPAGQTKGQHG